MAYIEIEKLKFKYPESHTYVLSDINLRVEKGEIVVICGKTDVVRAHYLEILKKRLLQRENCLARLKLMLKKLVLCSKTQSTR